MKSDLPVVVIGAGPVGMAAAAELAVRGLPFQVLESGDRVGASVRQWGHVRMFSPWEYDVSPVSAALLAETGWQAPPADEMPTGRDIVERLLEPLASHPRLRDSIRLGARVESVTRLDHDALRDGKGGSRESPPFLVRHRYLGFLLGTRGPWGHQPPEPDGPALARLVVDGNVVEEARALPSELPRAVFWDLGKYAHHTATIQVEDGAGNAWVAIDAVTLLAPLARGQ